MVYVLGPLMVHSSDTNTVCGRNGTTDMWSDTIYNQLLIYLSGLALISLLLLIARLLGTHVEPLKNHLPLGQIKASLVVRCPHFRDPSIQ